MRNNKNRSKHIITITLLISIAVMAFQSVNEISQPRTMPLVPMMRLLLNDMYTINEGMYTENFTMIEEGAIAIAEHPVMTEEDKQLIKNVLGEDMQEFVAFDMKVHHHADSLVNAARNKKMNEVIGHYRIVQQGCIDCHSRFRTKIGAARN